MQADLREDRQEAWISEEGLVCRNHHKVFQRTFVICLLRDPLLLEILM